MADLSGKKTPQAENQSGQETYWSHEENRVVLMGEWTVFHVADIEEQARKSLQKQNRPERADLSGISAIDTAGALLIHRLFPGAGLVIPARMQKLFEFLPDHLTDVPPEKKPGLYKRIDNIGRATIERLQFFYQVIAFTGEVSVKFARCFLHPRRFRLPSIIRHIDETGIGALPIIGLLGFLMSMVVSYQAAIQLQKFGASIFTVDLTVISLLREMGVLITAIMVAGRSGSAFAAEIGVMKLREEVDALRTMGMDPIETLVLPRLVALLITLPLLAFFANMVGLAGGAVMAQGFLDIPISQYIDRVEYAATLKMFFVGMVKAPVFAFLIAIICTYQGMHVTGSAESVGRLTTVAVVQSIFMVILVDALFSVIFASLGI